MGFFGTSLNLCFQFDEIVNGFFGKSTMAATLENNYKSVSL
jgi:hypothetical protein